MANLKIVQVGDPVLRKVCRPVTEITPRVKQLLDDMVETMRKADGVGLAAPQVGIMRRIAVVECEPGVVYELINPKIIARSGEQNGSEGCLSVPGKYGKVSRPMHVTVQCQNRNGETGEVKVNFYREFTRFGDREIPRGEDSNFQTSEPPPDHPEHYDDPML